MIVLAALSGSKGTVFILAAVVVALFVAGAAFTSLRRPARPGTPDIPPAMKPGPSDEQLERPRLERMQGWGIVTVLLMAISFVLLLGIAALSARGARHER